MAGATVGASAAFAAGAEAATYTVTSTADSGPGSLRAAITAANLDTSPDTINFNLSGSAPWTITLSGTPLGITGSGGLAIDGPGAGALSVVGGTAGGIFDISGSATHSVSISGLTLTGTTNGSAINDQTAPLTLTADTISGNTASASGGGIYSSADLTISGSTITGNSAPGGSGGGIQFTGRGPQTDALSITDSTISNNSSAQDGGGISSSEPVSVTDSQITGNQAGSGSGGGISEFAGQLSLTGSTVSGNTAANIGGGLAAKYGATIDNSTIARNTAAYGGGLGIVSFSFGGSAQRPVLIQNSTISSNQAPRGAGIEIGGNQGHMPITIKSSTLSGNQGTGPSSFGGGILIAGELYNPFDLVDSTITGNTATDGGGVSLSYGGAPQHLIGTGGSIGFDNSTIDGNTAATNGGGIYLGEYGTSPNFKSGTATINSTIVANDTAGNTPNDLYRASTSTSGGFNDTFSLIQNPGTGTLLPGSQALLQGVDPQLGPLANNGGPTETMLPSNTSPVIDAGKAQSGLAADQRGDQRTVDNGKSKPSGGDGTDIGSVELALIVKPTPTPTPQPTPTPTPPSISDTIGPASGITTTSATLHGQINTSGLAVTWHFQYGQSTAYGKLTPTQSIGTGHGQVPVSFDISGLKPGTLYHYRLIAVSSSGQTATSSDATLKTPSPTINVKPGAVRAAHAVRLFGSAGACTRGSRLTLISGAFAPGHKVAGRNALYVKVGAGSRYSAVIHIPAGRTPGRYAVTARCDGMSFGVTAYLRVLAPPPVARFTA